MIPEIIEENNRLWTTSLEIAEKFKKRHADVIRAIGNLDIPEQFKLLNFESLYRNKIVTINREVQGGGYRS